MYIVIPVRLLVTRDEEYSSARAVVAGTQFPCLFASHILISQPVNGTHASESGTRVCSVLYCTVSIVLLQCYIDGTIPYLLQCGQGSYWPSAGFILSAGLEAR